MTLVRAFSRVDEQGKIAVPANIRNLAKLKTGQLVEIRLTGARKAKDLIIVQRESAK